jgi:hypothetical protein
MTERAEPVGAQPVVVSRVVFEGIEAVRASGATNMLARDVVTELAEDLGYRESARWIRRNPGLYARAIFHGLRIEGAGSDPVVSE